MNSPDWLDHALDAHLASRPTRIGDIPVSADFQERCRDSAFAALDVLKMRQQLASIGQFPGSLWELFSALATRASVGLDRVFRGFGSDWADACEFEPGWNRQVQREEIFHSGGACEGDEVRAFIAKASDSTADVFGLRDRAVGDGDIDDGTEL